MPILNYTAESFADIVDYNRFEWLLVRQNIHMGYGEVQRKQSDSETKAQRDWVHYRPNRHRHHLPQLQVLLQSRLL